MIYILTFLTFASFSQAGFLEVVSRGAYNILPGPEETCVAAPEADRLKSIQDYKNCHLIDPKVNLISTSADIQSKVQSQNQAQSKPSTTSNSQDLFLNC